MFNYEIKSNDLSVEIKIHSTLDKQYIINFDKKDSKECAEKPWFTATTNMKDFIGNIKKIDGSTCDVEGYYEKAMRTICGASIIDDNIKTVGERVMVTEHLSIDGRMIFLVSKKRILYGDLNFINVGYSIDGQIVRYVRCDIYTGQSREIEMQLCLRHK